MSPQARTRDAVAGAVHTLSRLVDRLEASDPVASDELGAALSALVGAFAADGDDRGAAAVAAGMARRWSGAPGVTAQRWRIRAATLEGRALRRCGDLARSRAVLDAAADQHPHPWPDPLAAEGARLDLERALTLAHCGEITPALDMIAAVTEAGGLDGSTRLSVAEGCAELAAHTRSRGELSAAIALREHALRLLTGERSTPARRLEARLSAESGRDLTVLGRAAEALRLGETCWTRCGEDSDPDICESATVAACLAAQAAVTLGEPERALTLCAQLRGRLPSEHPHHAELRARIELARAAAELDRHGSHSAEPVYAELVRDLGADPAPDSLVFLAIALECHGALLAQLERMPESVAAGLRLAQLISEAPADAGLATIAECGNRSAERLISYGDLSGAKAIAAAIIARPEPLRGPDRPVWLRAHSLGFDALRRSEDAAALARAWTAILALEEEALEVLDGLVERYREHPGLRAAWLDTLIGRTVVLARLGRDAEVRRALAELWAQFGADEDPRIRGLLGNLPAPER